MLAGPSMPAATIATAAEVDEALVVLAQVQLFRVRAEFIAAYSAFHFGLAII